MGNLKSISDALKLIDSKKESLKTAFNDLQDHSHLLSSFSLTWSDLESHFNSIQKNLNQRFHSLESLESQVTQNQPEETEPCSSLSPKTTEINGIADSVSPRPELKRFCEDMDGKGLRGYLIDLSKDHVSIRNELPAALKCASDQEGLVLDAMEGVYDGKSNSKGDKLKLSNVRRSCILLLETLMGNCPNVGNHVNERAKKLALEWKRNMSKDDDDSLDALRLVHLVAAYGLTSEFQMDELVDYFNVIARYRQATKLCRVVGLGDKVADLVQKLISTGKQLLAAKFIFEFKLSEKFPPVSLLKDYVREAKQAAKTVCKEGKNSLRSQNEGFAKEMGALKSVIRLIEEYKLDSIYPRENLEKRIEQLEKLKANRKRPAGAPLAVANQKQPQQPHQVKQRSKKQRLHVKKQMLHQVPINRPHMAVPVVPAAVPNIVGGGNPIYPPYQQTHLPSAGLVLDHAASYQQSHAQSAGLLPNHPVNYSQSHLQSAGLMPDHPAPYESSSAIAYGMAGSTPAVASYHGSSAEYYGMPGGPMGFPGHTTPANSHVYTSEPYAQSGYYDGSSGYSGYGVGVPPVYHPSYYPQ